jgi:hypothetical protein
MESFSVPKEDEDDEFSSDHVEETEVDQPVPPSASNLPVDAEQTPQQDVAIDHHQRDADIPSFAQTLESILQEETRSPLEYLTPHELITWGIHFNDVTTITQLSSGQFGDYFLAQLHQEKWTTRSFGISAVFMKTLSLTDNRAELERAFVWELRLLMEIDHPHIVRLAGFTTANTSRWRLLMDVCLSF